MKMAVVSLLVASAQTLMIPSVALTSQSMRTSLLQQRCSVPAIMDVSTKPLLLQNPAKLFRKDVSVETRPCPADREGCLVLCDPEDICTLIMPKSLAQRLKVGFYFALWFALSVGYSITNKKVTNLLPAPWSVATATVVVGSVFVLALWGTGLRKPPKLSTAAMRTLLPIGTFHAIGHIAGTVGTAAGSVSFAQVVKAAGPVYACALSTLVLRQAVSARVWLSLLPIVAGVCVATLKELSFAWAALLGAVVSDLALALRNVLSKQSMARPEEERGENMTPANMFGVLTCISAAVSLPAALLMEGRALPAAWAAAAAASPSGGLGLATQIGVTGLFFYGYSEVAMKALNNVHPVTHAIGNTMRRVVIMLVCMVAFRTPMTPMGMAGSALAISGSYVYAMTKHAEKVAQQAEEQAADDAALVEKVVNKLPLHISAESELNGDQRSA
jgi:solute carrier family 35 protein E1